MRARLAELSPRAQLAIAGGVVLVYVLAVWFLVVSPKRAEATGLSEEVAAAELRLADARAQANRPKDASSPVTDVVRLAKAMPASADQSSLVLELAVLARRADVTLGSIALEEPKLDATGTTVVPVVVSLSGSYGHLSTFLKYARGLVGVDRGKVRASGRLLSVRGLELSESAAGKFPLLDATVTFDAFAYDGPIAPPTPPTPTPSEDDTTSGATAAGGTP